MITAVHSAEMAGAVTLLMVLRDMGNGVIRVESARVLDRLVALSGQFSDTIPVPFPLSPRMQDCVEVSMELAGLGQPPPFRDGLARCVCDAVTEVWLW